MKTGKDVIVEYCKNISIWNDDYSRSCFDIKNELIENVELKRCLEHCPISHGLDNHKGSCETDPIIPCFGFNIKQYDQCKNCWERALKTEMD